MWIIAGAVPVAPLELADVILDRVAAEIALDGYEVVERQPSAFGFRPAAGRFRRASKRMLYDPDQSPLVGFDRGEIWLDQGASGRELRFRLSRPWGAAVDLLAVAAIFTGAWVLLEDVRSSLEIAGFATLWIVVVGTLIQKRRLKRMFERLA